MNKIHWDISTNDFNLTPHLKAKEIECRCGCRKVVIVPRMLVAFETTRDRLGYSITISSGTRCLAWQKAIYDQININRRLIGAEPIKPVRIGYHVRGEAIDTVSIICPDDRDGEDIFIEELREDGWVGIGIQREIRDQEGKVIQEAFTHLDVRAGAFTVWHYGPGRPNG